MIRQYITDLQAEFKGYNGKRLGQDLLSGLTVTAVALPLALAFGVSSGATAAAGLITAIIAGLVIGMLSGASYQISGPTGAMTAILVSLVAKYGMQGVFVAGVLSGVILLVCGIFKFGRLVSFIPAPVITGFTSGIAIIIALGQIDNFFGVTSTGENALQKVGSYFTDGFQPNGMAVLFGALVMLIMIVWPKKWNAKCPSSLVGIIVAVILNLVLKCDVAVVGEIPKTLFLDERLNPTDIPWRELQNFVMPALSIAALGMIESLLCGASAGRMKGEKLNADRELVAQGIGNILIPFFGGVPATAAIARTSVAIKAGEQTRLTSVFHSAGLLLSMFLLAPVMSQIPLAALAGVLMMTAWRMNEWDGIRYIFSKKIKTAIAQFLITMAATVVFDLTVAIVIGVVFSILAFVVRISDLQIDISDVDTNKLSSDDIHRDDEYEKVKLVYLTGPIFFATSEKLMETLHTIEHCKELIFSMRGVPMIDASGAQGLLEFAQHYETQGRQIVFCSVQPKVKEMLDRTGVTDFVGEDHFYWDAQRAITHRA